MDSLNHPSESTSEIGKLLLLLFVILPLGMAVSVGIYGFIVWFRLVSHARFYCWGD